MAKMPAPRGSTHFPKSDQSSGERSLDASAASGGRFLRRGLLAYAEKGGDSACLNLRFVRWRRPDASQARITFHLHVLRWRASNRGPAEMPARGLEWSRSGMPCCHRPPEARPPAALGHPEEVLPGFFAPAFSVLTFKPLCAADVVLASSASRLEVT